MNEKNINKENLCINPPAIASSLNGPVYLCEYGLTNPNISFPIKNCKITSNITKITADENI